MRLVLAYLVATFLVVAGLQNFQWVKPPNIDWCNILPILLKKRSSGKWLISVACLRVNDYNIYHCFSSYLRNMVYQSFTYVWNTSWYPYRVWNCGMSHIQSFIRNLIFTFCINSVILNIPVHLKLKNIFPWKMVSHELDISVNFYLSQPFSHHSN